MNARWVRRGNNSQTQGIHIFIKECSQNHRKINKCINARLQRNGNHNQTLGIHMFIKNMYAKP